MTAKTTKQVRVRKSGVRAKGGKKNRKFGRNERAPCNAMQPQRTAENKRRNIEKDRRAKEAKAKQKTKLLLRKLITVNNALEHNPTVVLPTSHERHLVQRWREQRQQQADQNQYRTALQLALAPLKQRSK